jgi:hypothetical protein
MDLGTYIGDKVRAALGGAVQDEKGTLTGIAEAGADAVHFNVFGGIGTISGVFGGLFGGLPIIGGILDDLLDPFKPMEDAAGGLGLGVGWGWFLGNVANQLFQPLLLPLFHAVNANTTNEIFDPQTAAELVAKNLIDGSFGGSESSGGGLDGQHFEYLVAGKQAWPGLAELLELDRRGLIDDQLVQEALGRQAVPTAIIPSLMGLKQVLLSGADLALANLRGEMSHDEAVGYAKLLGISEGDLGVLINNTGEPPGLMQLLEAYRRGFIGETRLVHGIRQSRVRDEWVDVVEKLRSSPMSVADAARAVVEHER